MPSQQGLFAPEPLSLIHDLEGGIRYLPHNGGSITRCRTSAGFTSNA
jgi:hypothetical protein